MLASIRAAAAACGLALLIFCSTAMAADNKLYGVTSCCPNNFVEIDPATGAQTVLSAVGDAGFGFPVGASAIDSVNNTYFIVRNDTMGDPHILSIDTDTGAFVESPVLDGDLIKLGFDQDDGILFGITTCCPNEFVHIDATSGAFTDIAAVGGVDFAFGGGAAATDSGGDRFFVARSFMGTPFAAAINTKTGAVTESTMALGNELIKLGYDEDDDLLVGVTVCCPNGFVHIDQVSGAFTPVSDVGGAGFSFAAGAFALDPATDRYFVHRADNTAMIEHVISVDTKTGAATQSGAMAKAVFSLGFDLPAPPIEVAIDIKPGSDPNSINTKSKGLIAVAILGSDGFDVTSIDVSTLRFGPGAAAPAHDLASGTVILRHLEDVNGDGKTDLVSHYSQQDAGLGAGDTEACIEAQTLAAEAVSGCDAVRIVQ
jgi:hypothetical protein